MKGSRIRGRVRLPIVVVVTLVAAALAVVGLRWISSPEDADGERGRSAAGDIASDSRVEAETCPQGTERQGAPPPGGDETWCAPEGVDGSRPAGGPCWASRRGPYRAYFDDGGVREAGRYDDAGCRADTWRTFRRDGTLEAETHYRHGKRDGPARRYGEDGTLRREEHYRRGALHGAVTTYRADGRAHIEMHYDHGLEVGFRVWDEAGDERTAEDGDVGDLEDLPLPLEAVIGTGPSTETCHDRPVTLAAAGGEPPRLSLGENGISAIYELISAQRNPETGSILLVVERDGRRGEAVAAAEEGWDSLRWRFGISEEHREHLSDLRVSTSGLPRAWVPRDDHEAKIDIASVREVCAEEEDGALAHDLPAAIEGFAIGEAISDDASAGEKSWLGMTGSLRAVTDDDLVTHIVFRVFSTPEIDNVHPGNLAEVADRVAEIVAGAVGRRPESPEDGVYRWTWDDVGLEVEAVALGEPELRVILRTDDPGRMCGPEDGFAEWAKSLAEGIETGDAEAVAAHFDFPFSDGMRPAIGEFIDEKPYDFASRDEFIGRFPDLAMEGFVDEGRHREARCDPGSGYLWDVSGFTAGGDLAVMRGGSAWKATRIDPNL